MAQVTKVQGGAVDGTIRGSAGVSPALVHPKKCRQDAGATKSSCPLQCELFDLRSAAAGAKPPFDRRRVDRETNPECDPEELAGRQMRQRTGRKKDSHYRSC